MNDLRKAFHDELDAIHSSIVRLGAMVQELIPRGTAALLESDLGTSTAILEMDDDVDALSLDIEDRCYVLLSRQQPMASDLRAIMTAIRLTGELERSADLVMNIVKGSRRLHGVSIDPKLRGLISRMSEQAMLLFRSAIDSYADADADTAAAIDDMDFRLDELHAEYIRTIFTVFGGAGSGGGDLPAAVQLALVGRYYERLGDHAVNVGEHVVFMVTAVRAEHVGAGRAKSRQHAGDAAIVDHDAPAGTESS
jgi:phosphate transport system protein